MLSLRRYVLLSSLAAGAVVYHAFATRRDFFPATMYLSTSKLAVAAVGNLSFAAALCVYNVVLKVFLGNLREIELERVREKLSSAIMETCLALTIFRDEFNMSFVGMFTLLTFIKVFHWLVQDRVDYIEVTPTVSRLQHLRIVSFMVVLMVVDVFFLQRTVTATLAASGHSVQLLFAFEYIILSSSNAATLIKYILSMVDAHLEGRWEGKGTYVFYLDLITDMLHLFVYCIFFIIVFMHYGLPLHLIRDLYMTFRNFRNRIADFLRFRQVTARMDRFPDATVEDLARCDGICIICREEMQPTGLNKKLMCGHVFHLHCLRSWLERQQNCPTCRMSVFRPLQDQAQARGPQAAGGAAAAPAAAGAGQPRAAAAAGDHAAAAAPRGGAAAAAAREAAEVDDGGAGGHAGDWDAGYGPDDHAVAADGAAGGGGFGLRHRGARGSHRARRSHGGGFAGVAGRPAVARQGSGVAAGSSGVRGSEAGGAGSSAGNGVAAGAVPPMLAAAGLPSVWSGAGGLPAGVMWQVPQWYPVTSMAAFSNAPLQYAGQQTASAGFEQQHMTGIMPLVPLIPAISTPFPALIPPMAPNASPEQAQAAAAAAAMAAAAAAMAAPVAGLALMPPAMLAAAPAPATHPGAGGGTPQEQVAAAAAAAAVQAVMGQAGRQGQVLPLLEATQQMLQQQLAHLQNQTEQLRNRGMQGEAAQGRSQQGAGGTTGGNEGEVVGGGSDGAGAGPSSSGAAGSEAGAPSATQEDETGQGSGSLGTATGSGVDAGASVGAAEGPATEAAAAGHGDAAGAEVGSEGDAAEQLRRLRLKRFEEGGQT